MGADETKSKKRVAITTLGCKVNQYESAAYLSDLAGREEVEIVPFSARADVYVINTCAVTAKAGAQSRQLIRRAAARNKKSRLVVTGCYAQVAPQEVLESTGNPLCVVGNAHKGLVAAVAAAPRSCDLEMYHGDMGACREAAPLLVTAPGERTRAVLKVQDGCNQWCSYCIVPQARGPSRSVAMARVLRQAEIFLAEGYREVVLTGIHLGHYGLDFSPPSSLVALVDHLLERDFPLRYRLSSLEPTEVGPALLRRLADHPSLMPHLHIPLQSGDDQILAAMNRPYRREQFAATITSCATRLPEAAIGVDVLVGFPGEDETAFANTYELLAGLPISYLHVFPYSRRPGTRAAGLPDQVPGRLKDERTARLRELDRQKRQQFYRRHLGQIRPVLAERGGRGQAAGHLRGFTDNYIPVSFAAPARLINRVVEVSLEELGENGALGRMVSQDAG